MEETGVAMASAVISGVVGLSGLGLGLWTARSQAQLTREGRVHERRIDAYLDILRIIERRSLWIESVVRRLELQGDPYSKMPDAPPKPELIDMPTMDALLAAFGSSELRELCRTWRDAELEFEEANEIAAWNWEQDYHGPETPVGEADLERLRTIAQTATERLRRVEGQVAVEVAEIQGSR